jgi:hypothetical protein
MKRAFLFFFVIALSSLGCKAFAQLDETPDTLGDNILFKKEKYVVAIFHSAGWGIGFRTGQNKTYYQKRMFEFDLVEIKAPNEYKRSNENFTNSRRYVYGKLNNLYLLRAGYGAQKLINRKPYWGGIEVRFFYYGGLVVGFAKPVYLYITNYQKDSSNLVTYNLTTEKYNPAIHYPYPVTVSYEGITRNIDIFGKAPIYKGLDKIKPYPGLYAKVGFNFEYGSFNQSIKAIEVGATFDVFARAIPIMAYNKSNPMFINVYICFTFGKRYN